MNVIPGSPKPLGWVPTLAEAEKVATETQRAQIGAFIAGSKRLRRLRLLRGPAGGLVETESEPVRWREFQGEVEVI